METAALKKMFRFKEEERSEINGIDTFIGSTAVFEGTLMTDKKVCICIDGSFKGRLESQGSVIVTNGGRLEADIIAETIIINGTVTGNITARKRLDLGITGKIKGNVEAGSVSIATGGFLDGYCRIITEGSGASEQDQLAEKADLKSLPSVASSQPSASG